MLLYLFMYILRLNCLMYQFEASKNYLLIELFSQDWLDMKIEVAENQVIQSQIGQNGTQYLQLYYKLRIGTSYNLDIYMLPNNDYTITEVFTRDCPNNCSQNGECKNLQCQCSDMAAGDRCQYIVTPLYNLTQYSFFINSRQTVMLGIYFRQDDLMDDQGDTRNLKLESDVPLDANIYLLLPFEYPSSMLVKDKLVYSGNITIDAEEIDYSQQFATYRIKQSYYSFVLVFQNLSPQQQQTTLKYTLLDNSSTFQDFLLVAILGVISFIILIIIIYIVRKRCQYLQQIKKNSTNKEDSSENTLISFMPIVVPAKDQECIICLDSLETNVCRQTPCKHIMHDQCLKQWVQKQSTCPLCRDQLNDVQLSPRAMKSRNQTSNTFLNYQIPQLVQSDRNSVRSMIVTRSRHSRLAIFQ